MRISCTKTSSAWRGSKSLQSSADELSLFQQRGGGIYVQCDEIRWEKFLRRRRLGQPYQDNILYHKYENQIFFDLYYDAFDFLLH